MGSRSAWRWATAVGLAVLAIPTGGCGDLSGEELSRGVESLSALAAQGQLVANGVARDDTKATYARVMARTLGGQADHEAEKLADATPAPKIAKDRDAGVAIAGEISDLFSELETYPRDEHHGALVERHLREVQEQADALVAHLNGEDR